MIASSDIDQAYAREITIKGMASLFRLESQSDGRLSVVRSTHELDTCLQQGIIAAVLHFEEALRKVTHENWIRVLRRTWKE